MENADFMTNEILIFFLSLPNQFSYKVLFLQLIPLQS